MTSDRPGIALLATLDTKEAEAAYLADCIEREGGRALVVDCGVLGRPAKLVPRVTNGEVAAAAGYSIETARAAGSRGAAVEIMLEGLVRVVERLHQSGELRGGLAIGGAEGAVMGASALQHLPIGVPKLVLSPVVSGRRRFEPFVGVTDMMVMHSVTDIAGVNEINQEIYANAAASIVGMARRSTNPDETNSGRPCVGITMLGNTNPAVNQLVPQLEVAGWQPIVFHSNGAGGRAMEALVEAGRIDAVIDLTTNEIVDELFGGYQAGGPDRLRIEARLGVPVLVGLGCSDFFVVGRPEDIPVELRSRPIYYHNPEFSLVRVTREEMVAVASEIAERLNEGTGPLTVTFPACGLSIANKEGELFWDPDADQTFWDHLKRKLRPSARCVEVKAHVNDPSYVQALVREFLALTSDIKRKETLSNA
jgi:uncharacterized protein (UPF0261 family)